MTRDQQTLTARWIFPIDAPPLEAGTITLAADRIVAVEPHGTRRPDIDLGNVALLPGFVNAHTHLDLSGARGLCPPTPDFTQWLRKVIAYRRARTPDQVQGDIATGLAECLRFGTTLIGDIAAGGASWDLLCAAPVRAVVFHEVLGSTDAGVNAALTQIDAWSKCEHRERTRPGLSPHAPYSTHLKIYEAVRHHWMPTVTHFAETRAELELLVQLRGPFVEFLKELGVWNPDAFPIHPDYRHPDSLLIRRKSLLVHCNYLPSDSGLLRDNTVVICPRTHAAFGHDHHPLPAFLAAGAHAAVGTDSLASNPDLNILAEARHLRQHYPEIAPAMLLRMLTLNGAEALGFDAIAGSLTAGKSADLVVLPLPDESDGDPHDLVLCSDLPVARTMFHGQWR